jgi:hypothetical protein
VLPVRNQRDCGRRQLLPWSREQGIFSCGNYQKCCSDYLTFVPPTNLDFPSLTCRTELTDSNRAKGMDARLLRRSQQCFVELISIDKERVIVALRPKLGNGILPADCGSECANPQTFINVAGEVQEF